LNIASQGHRLILNLRALWRAALALADRVVLP
jgi:hypothetical protein